MVIMKIYFYKENGQSPVKEFLNGISPNIRLRIRSYIEHLVVNEGIMKGVAFRKLHGYPLEEIRVKESKKLHRVIIKVRIRDSILLLHGFTKKEGEETPQKELDIAYRRYLKSIREK